MLYTGRQSPPPYAVVDMPRRKLTDDEAEFVADIAASLKEEKSEVPPEGMTEMQRLYWDIAREVNSPETRAVLGDQIGKDLLKIARGEPIVIEKPVIPPKKRGVVGRWFSAVLA